MRRGAARGVVADAAVGGELKDIQRQRDPLSGSRPMYSMP
jgi:hypothetical protein